MSKRDLMLAVVEQGIRDYAEGMRPIDLREYAAEVQSTAEKWLFSDAKKPMSFLWYCGELGIEDPGAVREAAQQMRDDEDEKRAKRKLARKRNKGA